MDRFVDCGAVFIGGLNANEQQFAVQVLKGARAAGYTRFVEPCAGTFVLSNLAVQAGFKPEQIEASDINLTSCIMGAAMSGESLEPYHIKALGFTDEELLDPATAMYAMVYLRCVKTAGAEYYYNVLEDFRKRKQEHIAILRQRLEECKKTLGGIRYFGMDVFDHLNKVKDDPNAVIFINPPTYAGGYEKFFDMAGMMTYEEPPYVLFDPKTGYQDIMDLMQDAPALLLLYEETAPGETIGTPIYARASCRTGYNSYIATNHPDAALDMCGGRKIRWPKESKMEPLPCSILPLDYEITEKSSIQIMRVNSEHAQYYRMIWTHNFVGTPAEKNFAVLIDGYVAAVFGISKYSDEVMFVWYVMKAPHRVYRLGRLCYMLAQNEAFRDRLFDDISSKKMQTMRTLMITKYAENKEVRGIMKLVDRQKDKVGGYRLTYDCGFVPERNEQQTLTEWLRREKEWQQKRKKL